MEGVTREDIKRIENRIDEVSELLNSISCQLQSMQGDLNPITISELERLKEEFKDEVLDCLVNIIDNQVEAPLNALVEVANKISNKLDKW